MGVRIIEGDDGAVLYCSVSMWAFGPVFAGSIEAEEFLDWVAPDDPRRFSDTQLRDKYHDWIAEKEGNDAAYREAGYENNV